MRLPDASTTQVIDGAALQQRLASTRELTSGGSAWEGGGVLSPTSVD